MTNEEIDKLQEFIDSNIYADVPVETYNQLMTDAETLDMASFNKKWDKFLQDNSTGWKAARTNTDPLNKRIADTFKDDLEPSDNWIEENFPGVDINLVKKELERLRSEKDKAKAEKDIAESEKRRAAERYQRQKAVDNYEHSYLGMDRDNPINWLLNRAADIIILDNTKKAIIDDPNNDAGIIANSTADIVGTGVDFIPGYGWVGGKVLNGMVKPFVGPAIRTAQNLANGKSIGDTAKETLIDASVAGLGAKGAKKLKMKATDDAIEAAENAKNIGANSGYAHTWNADQKLKQLLSQGADVAQFEKWLKDPKFAKKIEDMTPYQYQLFKKHFEGTNVEQFLENLPYEERSKMLDKVYEYGKNNQKFLNNEKAAADLFKKDNPIKYELYKGAKAVGDKATPVIAKGSHVASRKAVESTPYKTKDPDKTMKTERQQDVIDWYKENYADQWRMGFKPRPINGELMMKAWQEGHDEGQW